MSRQAKRFSHWAHLCNFAPLWVRRCLFRLPARPKDLWHWAHLCNFAPEWDNKCLLRSLAYVNDLRHIVQVLLLAILILVKVSNLSSAVVDYYWRPFDPDRLSSSSLDMVIIMVRQNQSWQNIVDKTELTETELTEYGVDKNRVDKMKVDIIKVDKNRVDKIKVDIIQTWQNKSWHNTELTDFFQKFCINTISIC